jgi:hypothetical protein
MASVRMCRRVLDDAKLILTPVRRDVTRGGLLIGEQLAEAAFPEAAGFRAGTLATSERFLTTGREVMPGVRRVDHAFNVLRRRSEKMSVYLIGFIRARFSEVFDGRFERLNIVEKLTEESSPTHRCLTDGTYDVWVEAFDLSSPVLNVHFWPQNGPNPVTDALARAFGGMHLGCDTDPESWGVPDDEACLESGDGDCNAK